MPEKRLGSPYAGLIPILVVGLVGISALSIRLGAVPVLFDDMVSALGKGWSAPDTMSITERIFLEIRLPRALACILVGACLGVGGVLMQGLFRNPIVEPGLVGTSSGAAFGASLYFVFGALLKVNLGAWALPLAAC